MFFGSVTSLSVCEAVSFYLRLGFDCPSVQWDVLWVFFWVRVLNLRFNFPMLKSDFPCWLKVVDQKFLCRFAWNHYAWRAVFGCFFGFQLEAGCVSKNDGLPYCFCVVVIFVLLVCAHCALCAALCSGFGSVLSVINLCLKLWMLKCALQCRLKPVLWEFLLLFFLESLWRARFCNGTSDYVTNILGSSKMMVLIFSLWKKGRSWIAAGWL